MKENAMQASLQMTYAQIAKVLTQTEFHMSWGCEEVAKSTHPDTAPMEKTGKGIEAWSPQRINCKNQRKTKEIQ